MSEFTITRLGHHGDGIAEGPLYAPLTLPGEVITAAQDGQKLGDIRILTPSPDRVAPPCRHFKSCGGCQLQHASDSFVAGWKVDVVHAALAAQGLQTDLPPALTSPAASRRRATFSARRTKKSALVGFHARGSDVIIDIPDCQLVHPDLRAAHPALTALTTLGASRKAELNITVTRFDQGLDVAAHGGKPLDGPMRAALAQHMAEYHFTRLSWNGEVVAMQTSPLQRFGNAAVTPPPGSFLQATEAGEAALARGVQNVIGSARKVVDLFSGCGTFSLPLAQTAEVHAVEGEAEMTAALDAGWRRAEGLKKLTHEARDLFRRPLLVDELNQYDAAVIDPPRAGAEAQVAELAKSTLKTIAYVSCNPISFARDAAHLCANGYTLGSVQTVDQFRWSTHIELIASFTRRD
ncbi:class I SAM-dependent RNA methyltransferase [Rhodobacteraceae bacterium nBUS_22]